MRVQNRILKLMRRRAYHPLTVGELSELLEDARISRKELESAIQMLERQGRVVRTRIDRYGLPEHMNLIVGHLQTNRKGYGFVRSEGGDVFIRAYDMNGAMHGDKVVVRLSQRLRRRGAREGEVVRILERAQERIVGRFEKRGKVSYVVPADKRIFYDLLISPGLTSGASRGDIVVARIDQYPDKRRGPMGRIVEILGDESVVGVEIEVVIREHDLPTAFPPAVIEECADIPDKVHSSELTGRKDYRSEFTVTIDGLDAKDFDDAVSAGKDDRGNFLLKVHIADVSRYVSLDSVLGEEAAERGFSAYLVDRVIPMLPPKLSNEICSLNSGVDRLSFSVEMAIDPAGVVKDFTLVEGVINSDARLTYEGVDELFVGGDFESEKLRNCLVTLRELSDILELRRVKRGSINFETIEPKVILDERLKPVEVMIREETPATKLIEEAMILTNEVVAGFMHQRRAPMIYRAHERPDPEALLQIGELIKELGYPLKGIKTAPSRTLQNIIAFAHNRPERLLINYLMLRAMKQARYAARCLPHFGLASRCYTHFTSPIRRYPDLVIHHLVKSVLKKEMSRPDILDLAERLEDVCEHCSVKEREIAGAERESVELKLCELMKDHIGDAFWGIISGVASYGLFIELPNSAEGLVHVSSMSDDYYHFESEHFLLRGERTGKTFRLGQKVLVKVVNVVVGERRMDFELV
ncbi:MAG: ribonuclease R [Actinomycetota bacterium]|nr:ribonuclease R [Actinomycetota bacterium]